jgi:hypothetical protein
MHCINWDYRTEAGCFGSLFPVVFSSILRIMTQLSGEPTCIHVKPYAPIHTYIHCMKVCGSVYIPLLPCGPALRKLVQKFNKRLQYE